ncbi:MAG: 4Fe-4S dicluster domain-containing protein [Lachnospiraceae bacterium]|nr:4Fe-4S dicluster domain-containing protein [Lachnospiraceae bacterium]
MDLYGNSVYLLENQCKGCTNCIKHCPTQAIRVRNGKAVISTEKCIDCGECIRICPHHAKKAKRGFIDAINNYDYSVALPAPALYGQVNHLEDVNILLTALKAMGFDDVYEVSAAAEIISRESREYITSHREKWPIISTACPTVVRLIQVRYPDLMDNLLPLITPAELAARQARARAVERTGLPPERIGIFFISPCPSKVTAAKSPIGYKHSDIDCVLAIKDLYPILVSTMGEVADHPEDLAISGKIGISWGITGGEAGGLLSDAYVAADGIENIIRVLEDLEDDKFSSDLEFIELNACNGGCVGGVMTVENPFAAKAKMQALRKYMPVSATHNVKTYPYDAEWTDNVEYMPVFELADNLKDSMAKMSEIEALCKELPGLDCGCCGAPTCRALAEDVTRGVAKKSDCSYVLREYLHKLTDDFHELNQI